MQFHVKAYRVSDGITALRLSAASAAEAAKLAESQGYRVISTGRRLAWPRLGRHRRPFSVPLFSQELLALLEAGLGLVETIDILARKSRHAEPKKILDNVARHLREGLSFSRTLEAQPAVFPALYIATVRSSEQTGDLPLALRRYLEYHRQLNAVRDKVIAASVYPALLMALGALVVFFLLGYVVPRFSLIYEDLGRNLPWMSRMLIGWGQFVGHHTWTIAADAGAGAALLAWTLSRPRVRAALARSFWTLPAIGEKVRLYQLARFTRTLAMLLNGGIPFVAALDMVGELLRQPALRDGLGLAARAIREGRAVSDAFAAHALATEVGVRMLVVGERSGELGRAMERIARLYDDEVARWIDWFAKLFEPLLMIVIGLVIGIIVVLMYLPIFELADTIQ
jgi:general secretion pathway protein F